MLELKKTEDWAFFFLFFGGNLMIFNAIVGLIIYFVQAGSNMLFLDGIGFFEFIGADWAIILGGILNILFGILALLTGLKLFIKPFYIFLVKIDVAIIGIIFIFLGAGSFTTGGLILIIGGIYCFIYRLTVEGANNPKGK